MNSQRLLLTRVSLLVAVLSHEPTLTLHIGQLRLLCFKAPLRHLKHRLWSQGSVTGSINMPRHTGHIKSLLILLSADAACVTVRSYNFDVLFKYVAIFNSSSSSFIIYIVHPDTYTYARMYPTLDTPLNIIYYFISNKYAWEWCLWLLLLLLLFLLLLFLLLLLLVALLILRQSIVDDCFSQLFIFFILHSLFSFRTVVIYTSHSL